MQVTDHKSMTKPRSMQAKMLHEDDNTAIIGLYGVVFGGEDLTGEYFTKDTDFRIKNPPRIPVHIDHTLDSEVEMNGKTYLLKAIEDEVGEVIEVTADDYGLYMQLQFEKSNQYWNVVEAMYSSGKMGASSGADHRARKGIDGHIKTWVIGEETLTLTPAEPRTTEKVTRIKSSEPELQEPFVFKFKRNGEWVECSVSEPIKSTNQITDAKSAEQEPEVTPVTAIESDTSVSDLEGAESTAEITADEPNNGNEPEVLDMSETVATPEVETKSVNDFGDVLKSILANQEAEKVERKALAERLEAMENEPQADIVVNAKSAKVLQHGRNDNESNALKAWLGGHAGSEDFEVKASNATDMNIGTAADGGNLVHDGFYNQIIMKMGESDLVSKLPVLRLFGTEDSVKIPNMGGDFEQFVTTSEAATFDLDAPVIATPKNSVLSWKTKYTDISMQLLQSNSIGTGIEQLLANYFGSAMAATRNSMLVTEVLANGTNYKTFAGAAAIAFGELEDILGNGILGRYLTSDNAAAWVMQNSSLWNIRSIVGNDRQYWMDHNSNDLLGYPVYRTQLAPTMATGNKSVMFGNWNYLAFRESPGLTLQRDPYTVGVKGQVRITAHFAAAFNVTQAEAIGYGTQA